MKKLLLSMLFVVGVLMLNAQNTHTLNFEGETIGTAYPDWVINGTLDVDGERADSIAYYEADPLDASNTVLKSVINEYDKAYAGPLTEVLDNILITATNNVITARYYRSGGNGRIRCRVEDNADEATSGKVVNGKLNDDSNATVNGSWQDVTFTFGSLAQTSTVWRRLLFQINFGVGDMPAGADPITFYIDDIVVPVDPATGIGSEPIENLKVYCSDGRIRLVGDASVNEVSVFDLTGKKVKVQKGSNIQQVEVDGFTNGVYVIHVKAGIKESVYKVFKQ